MKKIISAIIVFSVIFSLTATCFSFTGQAYAALESSRKLLGEYISELYLKGPTVESSVRENLIDKGLDKDGLIEKREEFELRLCSSDEYDGYFFTDKEEFLDLFGKNDFTFLDGVYVWYAGVPEAKKAGLDITQNDPLISKNIAAALNFAIDVYGFCEKDSMDLFSDKFNVARKELVTFAIDCIYKIISALEDQIGSGTDKPRDYKAEYAETFCTEESGLYPYFDVRFKKNTPVMTGYYDADAYNEKKHDYESVKKSFETDVLLSVFETAYAKHKEQKDGGVLYYDFLTSFENARISYYELCSAVLKSEVTNPNITDKAKAYLKLKSLEDIFSEYFLPYADAYSAEFSAIKINYITIKNLIYFIADNPYFLNSVSAESMQTLIDNFTQSVSRLSPKTECALTSTVYDEKEYEIFKIKTYLESLEGIVCEENEKAYLKLKNVLDKIGNISASGVTVTVPKTVFYGVNGETVECEEFTFSFVPSADLYLGLVNEAKHFCGELGRMMSEQIPEVISETEKEAGKIKDFVNSYSFILGIHSPIIDSATGMITAVQAEESAKALLKKTLCYAWGEDEISDEKIFDIENVFNAATEYFAYKTGKTSDFLNSEKTVEFSSFKEYLNDTDVIYGLLLNSVSMLEKDISKYCFALQYTVENIAGIWGLSKNPSSGLYFNASAKTAADGTDPANAFNYKTNAFSVLTESINKLISEISKLGTSDKASSKIFIAAEKMNVAINNLLSDYGQNCYSSYNYDLTSKCSAYYGKDDLAYEMFKTLVSSDGIKLNRYIILDSNGQVSASEVVYKYFAFTVSAVSKDSTRENNMYSFSGNKVITNLITPLDVILKNRDVYSGNYARDKAEEIENNMNIAQLLVSSVNTQIQNIGYEITVGDAEKLLAKLSEINFTLSNFSLSYIASYKASTLDAIIDKAKAKTIDQTNTTPYYKLICDRFQTAYSNALNVSYDKTVPTQTVSEAAEILEKAMNLLEEYEKAIAVSIITVKDLETKITEAESLFARYDIDTPNSFISNLSATIDAAKKTYSEKLSTFTADELKYEVKLLETAIVQAENSMPVGNVLKTEISKITTAVKGATEYTADSWAAYANAVSKANLAASSSIEKVSVCNSLLDELRIAVTQLTPVSEQTEEPTPDEQTPEEETPVETPAEPEEPVEDSYTIEFLKQANEIYVKSVTELAEYSISSRANAEKIAVWTVALDNLKVAIEEKKDEATVVSCIVAIQLAKDTQIENPETNDN